GGPQPRLAAAVPLVCGRLAGHAGALRHEPAELPGEEGQGMNDYSRFLPWGVVGLAGLYVLFALVPPGDPEGQMKLQEAAALPVLDRGRVKPLDTFARTQLLLICKRQEYTDADDQTQPALRWLLDMMATGLANYYQRFEFVFIRDAELLKKLGLEARPD